MARTSGKSEHYQDRPAWVPASPTAPALRRSVARPSEHAAVSQDLLRHGRHHRRSTCLAHDDHDLISYVRTKKFLETS